MQIAFGRVRRKTVKKSAEIPKQRPLSNTPSKDTQQKPYRAWGELELPNKHNLKDYATKIATWVLSLIYTNDTEKNNNGSTG